MSKKSEKIIYISVTNDLVSDQRVHKVALTLNKSGARITLVGRKLKKSLALNNRPYHTKRFSLIFKTGFLFYATFNIRLFFYLLFKKTDLLVANDLDTLLANFLVSRIKNKPLVYDSHEYFIGVPEIQNRKFVKRFWLSIEKHIFPKLSNVYTVNDSIANLYRKQYGVDVKVVRNIAPKLNLQVKKTKAELNLPDDKKIILLQGSGININRGSEEAIEAMQYINNALFLIIGSGDVIENLKEMVNKLKLNEKVKFIDKLPFQLLSQYTVLADVGLTLDKDTNINYKYSLPNKLFDYVQAGVPVLASNLIEVAKIVKDYDVGDLIENHTPKHIAEKLEDMLFNETKRINWGKNIQKAAKELCWENEEKVIVEIYKGVGIVF